MKAPRFGTLLVPTIAAVAGFAILAGLGVWQLQRKAWKEDLIAKLEQRLSAAAAALPPPAAWANLAQEQAEFMRVRLHADFIGDARPAYVFTGSTPFRDDIKSPGYFVFQPARLPDGRAVAVNRGFSPDKNVTPANGPADIVGYLRWPQPPSLFVSDYDAASDIWCVADQRAMARALRWGEVAPFYVAQQSPVPASGLPRPGALRGNLRNNHLGYALTWFGLAAALAGVFGVWAAAQLRPRGKSASL